MTFEQWKDRYKVTAVHDEHQAMPKVHVIHNGDIREASARWDLFHLSDFRVSQFTGGCYWLVAGKSHEPHRASNLVGV